MNNTLISAELFKEFNTLDSSDKEIIKNYLSGKTSKMDVSERAQSAFYGMADHIARLIVEKNDEREEIDKVLLADGLEKDFIDAFYPFCKVASGQYVDAGLINSMKKSNLRQVSSFIVNKMVLFRDFERTPFEEFQKLTGNLSQGDASRVLNFINVFYTAFANWDISPAAIENKLVKDFNIDADLSKEMVKPLLENGSDIHMAHLSRQMNDILRRLPEKE